MKHAYWRDFLPHLLVGLLAAAFAAFLTHSAGAYTVQRSAVTTPAKVPVWVILPDNVQGKVPAMLLMHGSGGINKPHEWGYARYFTEHGIAAVIIDSFTPRGVRSTVLNQAKVSAPAMTRDALTVLQSLAGDPHIDADRVGIMGFSKGAQVAIDTSLAVFNRPGERQFALAIAMYPPCTERRYDPKTTGKPIHFLVGEYDHYDNPEYCRELAQRLRHYGADITLVTIKNAQHGWDVPGKPHWENARGENYSRCKFVEVSPRHWIEASTKLAIADEHGPIVQNRRKALHHCLTYGVSGGYSPMATDESLRLIAQYVERLRQPQ